MPEIYELPPAFAETFSKDGVVLIPNAIDQFWIDLLDRGIQKNINLPTERGRVWDRDEQGRTCFYDSQAWREISEYQDFIEKSPLASVAAQLLNTKRVNFFLMRFLFEHPAHSSAPHFIRMNPIGRLKGLIPVLSGCLWFRSRKKVH